MRYLPALPRLTSQNSCIIHHFFSPLPSIGLLLHSGYNPPTYTTLHYLTFLCTVPTMSMLSSSCGMSVSLRCVSCPPIFSSHSAKRWSKTPSGTSPQPHLSTDTLHRLTAVHTTRTAPHLCHLLSRQIPRFQVPTLRLAAPPLSTPVPPPIQPNPASSWDNACTTLPPRHRQADRLPRPSFNRRYFGSLHHHDAILELPCHSSLQAQRSKHPQQ